MSNSVFRAICRRLNLNPADPKFKIGPRAQRILREHQRQANLLREDISPRFHAIIERAIADLSGRSSNEWDDPTRKPIFNR
jgi:hypothetical protein